MSPNEQLALEASLEELHNEGLIEETLNIVRGGKEATVLCCRSGPAARCDGKLVAVKVYRADKFRSFRNDSAYQAGRVIVSKRDRRAVKKRTDWGLGVKSAGWTTSEFATLCQLYKAGADVPRPVAIRGDTILMEWIGDSEPAPQLRTVRPRLDQVQPMLSSLMQNIELMLRNNLVHGDLSPFNVLVRDGHPILIDFPQAADARTNPNAYTLLCHDLSVICDFFARFGPSRDAYRIGIDLWSRFRRGLL